MSENCVGCTPEKIKACDRRFMVTANLYDQGVRMRDGLRALGSASDRN